MAGVEHTIQRDVVKWIRDLRQYVPALRNHLAIGNGVHCSIQQATILKALGLERGVPDTFVAAARNGHHGLWLEYKRPGGKMSPQQAEWKERLEAEGYLVTVPESCLEAQRIISDYLGVKL